MKRGDAGHLTTEKGVARRAPLRLLLVTATP